MTFDEVLAHVLDLLQRQGRVSYRALKRRFDLDDEYLEDLKAEIIQAQRLAVDEDGVVLVWSGETSPPPQSCCTRPSTRRRTVFIRPSMLPANRVRSRGHCEQR